MTFDEWESKTIAFAGESPNAYARRAFNAALKLAAGASEGQAEPVAWRWKHPASDEWQVSGKPLWFAKDDPASVQPLYAHPSAEIAAQACHKCGLPMSVNPHPEAGKPPHYLEVGCPKECIPCLVKNRHGWATRAMKASGEIAALRERIAGMEKDAATYREAGVWDTDGKKFRTYSAENLNGKAMYVKEPK